MANNGPLTGRTIRGYEFRDLLGEGGFGAVYSAYQAVVGRDVAVKVIRPQYANQADFIAGFEAEARFVAQLEHAHIVPLYDFWRSTGLAQEAGAGAFIIMRLMRGGSLKTLLLRGALDLQAVCRMLHQVASALYVAHRYGIVHRDVKPGNILLDHAGDACLSDFGIAQRVGYQDGNPGVAGSPPYNAPEQLRGDLPMPESDIYSMGIVLYEMLAGQHPFEGLSVAEMRDRHLNEPWPMLAHPDFASVQLADVNRVIQRATAKNAAERYSDVRDMAAEFCRAIGGSGRVDEVVFTIPDSSQLVVLQAEMKRLYRLLEQLTDQHATAHDPQVRGAYQEEISQVKTELRYRDTGLRQAEKHAAVKLPPSLSPPPRPRHTLIGTEGHLTPAKAALLSKQSVTILGASGVGKSTLASELAHDEDIRRAFEGNVVWLSMGKIPDIPDLIGKWLEALGIKGDALRDLTTLEARLFKLQELMSERLCLVIVDDLWNIDDLETTLLHADIPFVYIVTTRQAAVAAGLLWNTVNVSALDMDSREALIRSLLPHVNFAPSAMHQALRDLLVRIGGIPRDLILLATRLRLAGASLARLQEEMQALIQTPAEIWDQGFASLKLSVDALDAAAFQAFRSLALFPAEPNTFSTAAGTAVCGNRVLLNRLVDASLLKTVDDRYALEPSFAEYALKLEFTDEAAVTQRFVEQYCVTVALVGTGTNAQTDYSVIDVEWRNIQKALGLAAENQAFHDMLIDAAIALAPAWEARGMVTDAETHLKAALAVLPPFAAGSEGGDDRQGTPLRRAKLHLSLAALYEIMGDLDASEQYAGDGLAALDGYTDREAERTRILLLRHLGELNRSHGEDDEAYAKWEEALEKAIAIEDDLGISRLHNSMGAVMASVKQQPERAHDHFLKSIEAARRAKDAMVLIDALRNLGLLEAETDSGLAERHLQESFALAESLGHYAQMSVTLQAQGYLEYERNRFDRAVLSYDEGVLYSRRAQDNVAVAWALLQLANALVDSAEIQVAAAERQVTEAEGQGIETKLQNLKTERENAKTKLQDAESRLHESFTLAQKRGDPFLCDQVAIVVLKMGETRIVAQIVDASSQVWMAVLSKESPVELEVKRAEALQNLYDRLSQPDAQATDAARALAYFNVGKIEMDEYGDMERARELFEKSLALATKANDSLLMGQVQAELETLNAASPDEPSLSDNPTET